MKEKIYYTYAWLRPDGSPYYIGKGSGNRAFDKRRKFCPPLDRVLILKKNLTEEEAFRHEVYMIFILGRKNNKTGILRNGTNGGEGVSGLRHTDASKERIGNAQRGELNPNYGKPEAAKYITYKSGENSPNWGREFTKEHCEKISKSKVGANNPNYGVIGEDNHSSKPVKCLETGIVYCSAKEAELQTGTHRQNISHCCRGKRKKAGGFSWVFA
jgi:hypothetical protein